MVTTILLGIISIGILIFVHESGHFLMARLVGVRVEVFSIGWGKGIQLFKWKETRIQLGFIPFGGYCKLAGDSLKDEITESQDGFYSISPIRRILVALGGPVFNYFLAVILFSMIVIIGYEINTYSNRIILVKGEDVLTGGRKTPAQLAGLSDGDILLEINGKKISSWDDITENIVRNALKSLRLKVLRGEKIYEMVVIPELEEETGRGLIGIYPWVEPVVGNVVQGEPADLAGIRVGDRILTVNGIEIKHHMDFYQTIEGKSKEKVKIEILREGTSKEVYLIPQKVDEYDSAGLSFQQFSYRSEDYPVFISLGKGFIKSFEGVRDTVRGISMLFSGKIRARTAVVGPAKLIYLSGVIAKEGFIYFLQVMSYISIALFIINLIPFPAIDGSYIIISLYELISRKKPNIVLIQKIQAFGFIFLILVLIIVTMNDITSFLGK